MNPEQFIDALFGPGWTEQQLPVFLEMVRRMQDDSRRYYEVREALAKGTYWIADRTSLNAVDDEVDAARHFGLL